MSPVEIDVPTSGTPESGGVWSVAPISDCDATRTGAPLTPLERAAVKEPRETDDGGLPVINVLYELCAVVDRGDVYAEPGFVMSQGQVYEATAGLMLCPNQPHAKEWRQAIARGRADIKLTASGRVDSDHNGH